MAEKINISKDALVKAGIYVAEFVGLRARPVPLKDLIENASYYNDKLVETTGYYLGAGNKRLHSHSESNGLGAAWGATIYVTEYFVSEAGRLYTSPDQSVQNLRVFTVKDFGTNQEAAEAEIEKLAKMQQLTLRGDINRGFPGEYYLYNRLSPLRDKS